MKNEAKKIEWGSIHREPGYIIAFQTNCPPGSDSDFYGHAKDWKALWHNKGVFVGPMPFKFYQFATKGKRDKFFIKYLEYFLDSENLVVPNFPVIYSENNEGDHAFKPLDPHKVFTIMTRRPWFLEREQEKPS